MRSNISAPVVSPPSPVTETNGDSRYDPNAHERVTEHLLPLRKDLENLARRLTRDTLSSEDLVQETYLKALRLWPNRPVRDPKAWAFRILTNTFLTHKRKKNLELASDNLDLLSQQFGLQARNTTLTPATSDLLKETGDELFEQLPDSRMKKVIADLPDSFRDVLLRVHLAGESYEHVAKTLRIPIGTVMSRLYRARERVKRRMENEATERGWAKCA